jgi:hypothetical protein
MTILVAGKTIPHVGALSELGRLALRFIDGGPQWFEWAAANPAAQYDFPDESALLSGVQQGLHASPLMLLPRLELMLSPVKLMTMSLADLGILDKAEHGGDSAVIAVQVKKILAAHGLLTRTDLASGKAFLAETGVDGSPLFQCLAMEDCLAIYGLLNLSVGQNAQNPALQKEAAAWGVRQARTPVEFVDYYKCFLHHAAKLGLLEGSAEQREAAADKVLETLLPLLFGALDCPQVDGLVAPAEVARAVGSWLTRGKQVGFARLSEGVQQIVQFTRFANETGNAAKIIINQYLSAAQSVAVAAPPQHGEMGQDGASCRYALSSGDQRAELQLGGNGIISLRRYQSRPGPSQPARATVTADQVGAESGGAS